MPLFVKTSPKIYGDKFVSFNVHCLIHLAQDVINHGSLDEFSAFCFENKLQIIKKHVRFTKGHTEDVGENLNILEELPGGGKKYVVWCSRHGNFILS